MNDSPSTARTPGVERRTLVAGAAWTIPVVATAVGAPLAAASTSGPTVAFVNGPYSVAACGTLKDIVLKVTTNGTASPTAGTLVSVILPEGLLWSDGTTGPKALPTDANGEVVISGVKATGTDGDRSVSASFGTGSALASVSVASSAPVVFQNGTALPPLPTGIRAVTLYGNKDGASVLGSDGHLYVNFSGSWVKDPIGGVTQAVVIEQGGRNYVLSDGTVFSNGTALPPLPGGVQVVTLYGNKDGASVLGSDGHFYVNFSGNWVKDPIADVTQAVVIEEGGRNYLLSGGTVYTNGVALSPLPSGVSVVTLNGNRDGAVVIGSDGHTYVSFNGNPTGGWAQGGTPDVSQLVVIEAGGRFYELSGDTVYSNGTALAALPAGVTPVTLRGNKDGASVIGSDGHTYNNLGGTWLQVGTPDVRQLVVIQAGNRFYELATATTPC